MCLVVSAHTGNEIGGDDRRRDVGAILDVVYVTLMDHLWGGLWSPVGCLDKVLGALFLTPGMWTILK